MGHDDAQGSRPVTRGLLRADAKLAVRWISPDGEGRGPARVGGGADRGFVNGKGRRRREGYNAGNGEWV
jgi:hypothetical protein